MAEGVSEGTSREVRDAPLPSSPHHVSASSPFPSPLAAPAVDRHGVATNDQLKNKDRRDPSSTRDLLTVYWFACHLPNVSLETARGITATVVPIMVRQLMTNLAESNRNAAAAEAEAEASSSSAPPFSGDAAAGNGSDAFLGLMLACIGLGTAMFNVPVGVLVRKVNLSAVATSGGVLYGSATLLFILVIGWSLWKEALQPTDAEGFPRVIANGPFRFFQAMLLLSTITWGMAFSCMSITRLLFVQHRVPKSYRSRLMSLVGGAQRWAMAVGPLIAGFVTQHFGIFAAFALHIPLCAINAYSLYRSELFRDVSDEVKAEDLRHSAVSAADNNRNRRSRAATEPQNEKQQLQTVQKCEDVRHSDATAEVVLPSSAGTSPSALWAASPPPGWLTGTAAPLSSSPVTTPIDATKAEEESRLPSLKEVLKAHWPILFTVGGFAFTMTFLRSSRTLLLAVNAMDLNLPASAVGLVLSLSFTVDATSSLGAGSPIVTAQNALLSQPRRASALTSLPLECPSPRRRLSSPTPIILRWRTTSPPP